MAVLLTTPRLQFFDNNGDPLSGGLVYLYEAGTTTPKASYTDSSEATPNANPVELDSAGRAPIWINGSYKIVVKDALGNTISTDDNITSFNTSATTIDQILPSQAGNAGKALVTNGATASWADRSQTILTDHISGYTLANNVTDATNDIDISAGVCADTTSAYYLSGLALTKQIDAAWAAGTGVGMLDTGAVANTTYHIYAIRKDLDGTVDYIASTSASAPTLPSGYTKYRRINSFVRAGGANKTFVQVSQGCCIQTIYKVPTLDVDVTNQGTSSITYTLASVPTGVKFEAIINALCTLAGSAVEINIRPLDQTDAAASTTNAPLVNLSSQSGGNTGAAQMRIFTNTSAQIAARAASDTGVTLKIATVGFVDARV